MGLRVMRNMPPETSEDVAPGFVGFMVVLARTNETMPASPKTMPTEAITMATATRTPNDTSTGATNGEATHIRTPKSSATAGGGTFNSSQRMPMMLGHSD